MSDKPILFSAPMIRALLDGKKTMTRRLAWRYIGAVNPSYDEDLIRKPTIWQKVRPGDWLWVRETFETEPLLSMLYRLNVHGKKDVALKWTADSAQKTFSVSEQDGGSIFSSQGVKKRPSIYMPRWASRLTLVVTETKMERLAEISDEDAIAEGATSKPGAWGQGHDGWNMDWPDGDPARHSLMTPRFAFGSYWERLHGSGSWDENPEVVALTFTVHKTNVDQMETA